MLFLGSKARNSVVVATLLALGATTVGQTFVSLAYAQSRSVDVVGNRRVDSETIRGYFTGNDEASVQKGVEGLKGTGLFRDVRVSRAGSRLMVTVVENNILNRVVIEGNKRVKSEVMLPELQSKPRGPYSPEVVRSDVERMIEIYRRSGIYDVQVEPKTIDNPNGRIDLVFEVREGKKAGISKINFVGNTNFSDRRLKDEMVTGETGMLSWLKGNDVYDPDRLNADQETLRRFYLRNGYADFRVISAVADFDKEKNAFFVTITVEEGQQYRFGTINVVSNIHALDGNSLRSKVRTSQGSVYNVELVDKSMEDISIEAAKKGYAFAQVRPRGERDPASRTVNVTYVVEEGPRVYVERINIRGNVRTRDNVIRREFDIAEGDAYNRVLVDRAERRLNNLSYFKNVKITSEPGSAPDRVIINVDLEDQPTGEFSIGAGFSTADGIVGEVSVAERNFMGKGQYVKVGAQLGSRTRGADFSFTEPFFMDYRLSAGFDLFHKEAKRSNYVNYDTLTTGGGIRFGIPITEEFAIQTRYTAYAQRINLTDDYADCIGAYTAACLANGEGSVAIRELNGVTRIISMVGYSLIYNTLDRTSAPKNGLLVEFKQDFAGLGGDGHFLKTEADVRYYKELVNDYIGSIHLQGGNVISTGSKSLKVIDQFFKGPELVRGFATAGIGPRDFAIVQSGSGTYADAVGGTTYAGASVEVTMPISFLPKDFGMRFATFADAGTVFGYNSTTSLGALNINLTDPTSGKDSTKQYIRSSAGVGLLWSSPFGPIRFDYAWALSKAPWDRTQAFRFSGGTKF